MANTINSIISQRFVSCPLSGGDVAIDAKPGELLTIEPATGVTVTVTLPASAECVGAPLMVRRRGAGGDVVIVPLDHVDALDDVDTAEVRITGGDEAYRCVQFFALEGDMWCVTSRS